MLCPERRLQTGEKDRGPVPLSPEVSVLGVLLLKNMC